MAQNMTAREAKNVMSNMQLHGLVCELRASQGPSASCTKSPTSHGLFILESVAESIPLAIRLGVMHLTKRRQKHSLPVLLLITLDMQTGHFVLLIRQAPQQFKIFDSLHGPFHDVISEAFVGNEIITYTTVLQRDGPLNIPTQPFNSSQCGWYALAFLLCLRQANDNIDCATMSYKAFFGAADTEGHNALLLHYLAQRFGVRTFFQSSLFLSFQRMCALPN